MAAPEPAPAATPDLTPPKPVRTPEQVARDATATRLDGMVATVDTLRAKGIDGLMAELGGRRPKPDYAQQALDALNVAGMAFAAWAKAVRRG